MARKSWIALADKILITCQAKNTRIKLAALPMLFSSLKHMYIAGMLAMHVA